MWWRQRLILVGISWTELMGFQYLFIYFCLASGKVVEANVRSRPVMFWPEATPWPLSTSTSSALWVLLSHIRWSQTAPVSPDLFSQMWRRLTPLHSSTLKPDVSTSVLNKPKRSSFLLLSPANHSNDDAFLKSVLLQHCAFAGGISGRAVVLSGVV